LPGKKRVLIPVGAPLKAALEPDGIYPAEIRWRALDQHRFPDTRDTAYHAVGAATTPFLLCRRSDDFPKNRSRGGVSRIADRP
jgi:hypothetical protein